jgi:hypothetical protein
MHTQRPDTRSCPRGTSPTRPEACTRRRRGTETRRRRTRPRSRSAATTGIASRRPRAMQPCCSSPRPRSDPRGDGCGIRARSEAHSRCDHVRADRGKRIGPGRPGSGSSIGGSRSPGGSSTGGRRRSSRGGSCTGGSRSRGGSSAGGRSRPGGSSIGGFFCGFGIDPPATIYAAEAARPPVPASTRLDSRPSLGDAREPTDGPTTQHPG